MLFSVLTQANHWSDYRIVAQSLKTGERRVLVRGATNARYLPTGHLVYAHGQTLMAAPFNAERLELTGAAVPILDGVMRANHGGPSSQWGFSGAGSLVYVPGGISYDSELVWVDRTGAGRPLKLPPGDFDSPRISPDGNRLAVTVFGDKPDIWIYDVLRETLTRLTFDGYNSHPVWTPDGTRVTFSSYRDGSSHLLSKPVDGSGAEEQVGSREIATLFPQSWSPDGRVLTLSGLQPSTRSWDIWLLSHEGKASPFLQTRFTEGSGILSPDGRWLAYVSNESGMYQVYVQAFPGPGGKWQVSTDGGTEPVWARNGRELFYHSGHKMMTVEVTSGPAFTAGNPKTLFESEYQSPSTGVFSGQNYDVTPDGQRFIMVRGKEAAAATDNPFMNKNAPQINVVLNLFEELKRRVPVH
ncbi:MAG: hypothetical protein DMG97_20590 [Acidobacteria bacterium]|nr:MAG: hypothetical protein DMG97_20590 [Acidobacteriota bacterium]